MNKLRLTIIVGISILGSTVLHTQEAEKQIRNKYAADEIKADFKYLYETLEASSYDLFFYTPKSVFDKEYKRIYKSITDSLSLSEINRLFQSFAALANISHCSIEFPYSDYQYFYQNGGRFFPIEINFVDDKPIVIVDYSVNPNISIGDELISIAGESIDDILKEIYTYMSGENDYFRQVLIESGNFTDRYWYVFGDFLDSILQVKKPSGEIISCKVKGVPLDEYFEFVENNPELFSNSKPDREFRFIEEVAYLRPGVFYNISSGTDSVSKYEIHKRDNFNAFIDSAFIEISKRNAQDLIIDIRGNDGGSDAFSNYMMAYFANRPFKIASKISLKTSQMTKDYWKDFEDHEASEMKEQIMTLENGTYFELDIKVTKPRKDSLHFNGKVYLLIDRFSFSMASAVASIFQDYSFGVLIGEETAQVPSSCASMHDFLLPNTKIKTHYPKAFGIRPNGDATLHGVIPDFIVKQDIHSDDDQVLEYTLKLINL